MSSRCGGMPVEAVPEVMGGLVRGYPETIGAVVGQLIEHLTPAIPQHRRAGRREAARRRTPPLQMHRRILEA